jgi:hypothetical protein
MNEGLSCPRPRPSLAPIAVCGLGEVDYMKAVTIKKDQARDKATADFQAMGILRCDVCGEDFVI